MNVELAGGRFNEKLLHFMCQHLTLPWRRNRYHIRKYLTTCDGGCLSTLRQLSSTLSGACVTERPSRASTDKHSPELFYPNFTSIQPVIARIKGAVAWAPLDNRLEAAYTRNSTSLRPPLCHNQTLTAELRIGMSSTIVGAFALSLTSKNWKLFLSFPFNLGEERKRHFAPLLMVLFVCSPTIKGRLLRMWCRRNNFHSFQGQLFRFGLQKSF